MINDLDIVQWAYLLDPCFQLVNTAGKPLTEGYIEVYYHGTRTKYYCASDFDGTLHPFQIPLDSLGSNIVLASPDYAYDVYVYNKFGSLVMSRYNVTPGLGGGGGGIPGSDLPEHWLGTDGEAINIASDAVNVCLPLPVSGSVDYEGEFVDHFDETTLYLNEGMYIVEAVIQFRQSPWDLHNSLNNLKIDTGDGDSSYYWQEDVSGPESNNNVHERKVTFIRKVTGDEPYPFYISPSVGVQLNDVKIRRLNIVKLNAGGAGGGHAPMYKPGPGIAVDDEGVISVTGMQPVSGMNEYVTNITYNNDVTEIFNEIHNVTGDITNIYNEIQSVTGDIHEYTAGSGIIIEDDVISLDPDYVASGAVTQEQLEGVTAVIENTIEGVSTTIINDVSGDISAVTSVLNDKIDAVSAAVPEAQVNADWNATEGKAEILNKPDLSVYATKDELQEVSSNVVSHDELQSVTSVIENNIEGATAVIENTIEGVSSTIIQTIEGTTSVIENTIEGVSTTIVNEYTGDIESVTAVLNDKIDAVSAAVPEAQVNADWNATEGKAEILNKPDLSVYATKNEVETVTGVLQDELMSVSTTVSGIIADQVQSDWDEDDTSDPAYIKNKPEEIPLVAGENIYIERVQDTLVISASSVDLSPYATNSDLAGATAQLESEIQTVSSAIPDVSEFATRTEVDTVSSTLNDKIDAVSGAVPEAQVNADWNATEGKAEILNKPDLTVYATKTEVETATGNLDAKIDAVSASIPEAQVQSDWTETATGDPAYIKNKPAEYDLIAGQNIEITTSGDDLVINAVVPPVTGFATEQELQAVAADVQTVSSAIPDISNLATKDEVQAVENDVQTVSSAIPDISNLATKNEVQAVEDDVQTVSAAIPDISDLATKSEVQSVANDLQTVSAAIPDISDLATKSEVETVASDLQTVSAAIPDISDLATKDEVNTVAEFLEQDIQTVSAAIPDVSNFATVDEVNAVEQDVQIVSAAIPDISGLATEQELQTVSAAIPAAQVNADWAADSGVAEILNKPDTTNLVAGSGIAIVESGSDLIISATANGITEQELATVSGTLEADIQTVSAAIPDVSNLATKSEVDAVEQDVQTVSGAIVHYQGASGVAIDGDIVSLDEPLMIEAGNGITFTAEGDTITISADVPTVTGYVTESELATATGVLENDIQTVSSAIPDVSNLATKTELQTASGTLEDKIDAVSGALPETQTLVAGANIEITESNNEVTISANVPPVTGFATEEELQMVSSAIDAVSGQIPETTPLVAGNGISITEQNDQIIIAAEVPTVTGFATEEELQAVSSAIPDISDLATEADLQTVSAAIPEITALVAGSGIVIDAQNDQVIISATGAVADSDIFIAKVYAISYTSYYGIDSNLTTPYADVQQAYNAGKTIVCVLYSRPSSGSTYTEAAVLGLTGTSNNQTWFNFYGSVSGTRDLGITYNSSNITVDYRDAQADWNQTTYTGNRSYIKNKPNLSIYATNADLQIVSAAVSGSTEYTGASGVVVDGDTITLDEPLMIEAGSGIVFTQEGDSIIISSTGGGGGTGDVTKADLASVSGQLESDIQTVSGAIPSTANFATKQELQTVSAAIPEYTGASGIVIDDDTVALDEPLMIEAGSGITFTASGDTIVIDADAYTGASGIAVDNTNKVISWMNTAGITDIQIVSELPASPDAHTMYLIQET